MRLRRKPWARPEIEECDFVIVNPFDYKGRWNEEFKNNNPIYLELGCGMGRFICENALKNPDINYIGIDMKNEILVYTKRNVENNKCSKNIRLIPLNIENIEDVFEKDEISRIYINFCNPWPKTKQNKRRLTYGLFLERYKKFLKPGSQIWFKTDDSGLFNDSLIYFEENGFKTKYITRDLHSSDFKENIMTEYEIKFINLGLPIMFLIAELK